MKWIGSMCRAVATLALALGVAAPAGAGFASEEPPSAVSAAGEAAPMKADLSEVRARARTMPVDRRIDIDKRIAATVERVNAQASGKGQSAVAKRLAVEFETTSESLLEAKREHGLSWGEMVIAHTLLANSEEKVTLPDLATLRSEGLTWGAIAFGLRFHMEDFEEAIKAEGKVAMGLSKADGKAEPIRK